jgi:hypothetical protein
MLDQLTQNADVRAQEAAAREARDQERREAESKASLAANAQTMELQKLAQLTAPLDIDEDPTARGYKPEDIALMQKWGVLHQLPTPNVSTSATFSDEQGQPLVPADRGPAASETPMANPSGNAQPINQPAKPRYGYVGTAAQREKARLKAQSGAVIQSLMEKPETLEAGQFLAKLALANDGIVPADTLAQYIAPAQHIGIFNEPTGKVTVDGKPVTSIAPNTHVFNRGYGPYHPRQYVNAGVNDKGEIMLFDPDTQRTVTVPGSHRPTTGNQDPTEAALGVPQGLLEKHQETQMILHPDETGHVDPMRMGLYRQSALNIIQSARVSPTVRTLAREFIVNPSAAREHAKQFQLSVDEVNDLGSLIGSLGPAELYTINPVQHYKPAGK